jgi:hypothetical protein
MSGDPQATHAYRAEPPGYVAELFDQRTGAASVRLAHQESAAWLRLELPGQATGHAAAGAQAQAQVGDLSVSWTTYDDRLKEDLVLAKPPASNEIKFTVEASRLAFAEDEQGGYVLWDVHSRPRFHVLAPTVQDAQGKTGQASLTLTKDAAVIRIDAAFLATAAYPVTVDPTVTWTLETKATTFTYDAYAPVSQLKSARAQ